MQRIFLDSTQCIDSFLVLDSSTMHHLFDVCRLNVKDQLEIVVDNKILKLVEISAIASNGCDVQILDQWRLDSIRQVNMTLIQALPKQDKLTEVARLVTTVGASDIYPVVTDFCNVSFLSENKISRVKKTIESAAKQSKQHAMPTLHDVQPLSEYLSKSTFLSGSLRLVAYEHETTTLSKIIHGRLPSHIYLAIGPEGGFSSDDLMLLKNHSFYSFTLGNYIFRTEHAGFAAINYLDGYLASIGP